MKERGELEMEEVSGYVICIHSNQWWFGCVLRKDLEYVQVSVCFIRLVQVDHSDILVRLEACVNRLLEQYEALLSYFQSTDEESATVTQITEALETPIKKAYLMFLSDSLPIISIFNKIMQQQSPTVHFLHQELQVL